MQNHRALGAGLPGNNPGRPSAGCSAREYSLCIHRGEDDAPAGEYRIQKAADTSSALLIQRADRSAAGLVMSRPVDTNTKQAEQSKAVFHKYGERYFLSQVWTAGHARGRQLVESAKEKEQALVAHNQRPEEITVVARLISPKP